MRRWDRAGATPQDVALLALHQQRIYVFLGYRHRLADRVLARLPGRVRAQARDILAARRALARLTPPTTRKPPYFRTGRPLPARTLLGFYRKAERGFGVEWEVLAAINLVETVFNRIRGNSSANAEGPMQFIPQTWRAYGLSGNVREPHDAILGAANYLRASGAPGDNGRAIYAYNHSWLYVSAVRRYAGRMRRRPHAYYELHAWQVYVRTGPRRAVRITGPGR